MGAAESVVRKAVKTAAGLAARRAVEAPGPAARLYGGSLYELAAGEDLAQTIMEELRLVWQLFKENPSYRKLLKAVSYTHLPADVPKGRRKPLPGLHKSNH